MIAESTHRGTSHLALNLLRIMAGFLFAAHGAQKLFAAFGAEAAAEPFTMIWVAGVLEFYGGLLVMAGLFTRPVAVVLAGLMAAAYVIAHAGRDPWPILNGGELAALYCVTFFFLASNGGGAFSLDGALNAWRRRRAA